VRFPGCASMAARTSRRSPSRARSYSMSGATSARRARATGGRRASSSRGARGRASALDPTRRPSPGEPHPPPNVRRAAIGPCRRDNSGASRPPATRGRDDGAVIVAPSPSRPPRGASPPPSAAGPGDLVDRRRSTRRYRRVPAVPRGYIGQLPGGTPLTSCSISPIVTCGPNLLSPGATCWDSATRSSASCCSSGPSYAGVSALAAPVTALSESPQSCSSKFPRSRG
jgi:hypothetical protein